MHIVVNALLVYGPFTGVQHAILQQLRALLNAESPHRFSVLALRDVPIEEHVGQTARPYQVIRAPLRSGQRMARILWEQLALPRLLSHEDAGLFYAPGYLTTLRWDGPRVVFVHDTIALSHPHLCRAGNALNYRLLLPLSARRAARVAVPSQASADDVLRYCRVPAARIRVIPHGARVSPPAPEAVAAARAKFGLHEPYLIAASAIEPKKNFARLIRWFDHWQAVGARHHLVIAGEWGWGSEKVRRALARSPYGERIHMLGHVADELPALMAAGDLLLAPSIYEGFGLPALEAMALGTPVAVSDRGALPEVVGDAGLVIPLEDVLWQAEIPILLRHPERLQAMRDAGRARAAGFTWERAAQQLLALFDEAVAECERKLARGRVPSS